MSKRLLFLILFVLVWTLGLPGSVMAADPNLVAYYTFDDGTAKDVSGYDPAADGTLGDDAEIVYDAETDSNVLHTDGDIDYVDCGNDEKFEISGDLTAMCWVKLNPFTAAGFGQFPFAKGDGSWRILLWPTSGSMICSGLSGDDTAGGGFYVMDEEWHHVCGAYDPCAQLLYMYVDGELIQATGASGSINVDNTDFYIGNNQGAMDSSCKGYIDEVRIYNRCLSEAEIMILAGVDPGTARQPYPTSGSLGVPTDVVVYWKPGSYVADTNGHHVYFGTSWDDVNGRAAGVDKGIQDVNYYPVSGTFDLAKLTKYYWAVDEMNDACDPCYWPSRIWEFTTLDYKVWDNFDQYGDTAAMEAVWQEQAGTGADVLRQTGWPRFPGQNTGVGMKFKYDNSGTKYYSEVKREIADANKDWTEEGIKALDLWFAGDKDNITTGIFGMYAAVEDKDGHLGVVNYGDHGEDINDLLNDHGVTGKWVIPDDPEFTQSTSYRCWHIRLADFNENSDVNLADVNNFYLGFGDRTNHSVSGGTGEVWFEEFRFYLPRCLPGYVIGDITDDCRVNYEDLKIMSDEWLVTDYNIPTSNPGTSNLIAFYQFEGDYTDSSSNGHDGTKMGTVMLVDDADRGSKVASFPGINAYIDLGGGKDPCGPNTWADIEGPITLAAWIKIDIPGGWQAIVAKGEGAWRLQTEESEGAYFGCTGLSEGAGWGVELTGGKYILEGGWQHVAGVYDPNADGDNTGKMLLYVNGELVDSADASGEIETSGSTAEATIAQNIEEDSYFSGRMDDVRIYTRALTQAEVAYLAADGGDPLYVPLRSKANLYSTGIKTVNFDDFAVMAADSWLEEQLFGN